MNELEVHISSVEDNDSDTETDTDYTFTYAFTVSVQKSVNVNSHAVPFNPFNIGVSLVVGVCQCESAMVGIVK